MRQLLYRRYWARVAEERRRLMRRPGVSGQIDTRSPSPWRNFIDYHGQVPGTLPEKMVYQVLEQKQVRFYYAYFFGDIPFTDHEEKYRPDFLLPDYNIIIEVQGVYWHGREGKFESDYQRALLLEAAGYHVYTVTDAELLRDPYAAIAAIPELAAPPENPGRPAVGYRPVDPTASLAAQRRKWPKIFTAKYANTSTGTLGVSRKGVQAGFKGAGSRVPAVKEASGDVYDWRDMDADLATQYRAYGQEWRTYMDELKDYFDKYGKAAKTAYPDLWTYYNRWKNWWARFGRGD